MIRNLFIYGMSGAGKDTVANFLRDRYDYLKLRIAGTIKQFVYETYGYPTLAEFEQKKREIPEIRDAHNGFGNVYDEMGTNLSNEIASINRLKNLISGEFFELEIYKDLVTKPRCICDVRTYREAETALTSGYYGIFLDRQHEEFRNTKHKTEQNLFENGGIEKIIESFDNLAIILNSEKDFSEKKTLCVKYLTLNNNIKCIPMRKCVPAEYLVSVVNDKIINQK